MAHHTIKGAKLHEVLAASEPNLGTYDRVLSKDVGDLYDGEVFHSPRETKRGVVVKLRGRAGQ